VPVCNPSPLATHASPVLGRAARPFGRYQIQVPPREAQSLGHPRPPVGFPPLPTLTSTVPKSTVTVICHRLARAIEWTAAQLGPTAVPACSRTNAVHSSQRLAHSRRVPRLVAFIVSVAVLAETSYQPAAPTVTSASKWVVLGDPSSFSPFLAASRTPSSTKSTATTLSAQFPRTPRFPRCLSGLRATKSLRRRTTRTRKPSVC